MKYNTRMTICTVFYVLSFIWMGSFLITVSFTGDTWYSFPLVITVLLFSAIVSVLPIHLLDKLLMKL